MLHTRKYVTSLIHDYDAWKEYQIEFDTVNDWTKERRSVV